MLAVLRPGRKRTRLIPPAEAVVAQAPEAALREGRISQAHLFDEAYQAIPGTNPQQHTARFNALTDAQFGAVQEGMLASSNKVVYCLRSTASTTSASAATSPGTAPTAAGAASSPTALMFTVHFVD